MDGLKLCPGCRIEKALLTFGKDNRTLCRNCRSKSYSKRALKASPEVARAFIVARIKPVRMGFAGPCWIWQRTTDEKGYARAKVTGYSLLNVQVHRAAYELFVGPIRDGLHIDHLCCVASCVNPAHLEAVAPEENWRRQHERMRERRAAANEKRGEGCVGQRPGTGDGRTHHGRASSR